MKPLEEILAKSVQYGKTSVLDHSTHVETAIEKISDGFFHHFEKSIARQGAILHDLGKAHPHFQRRMQEINANSLAEEREGQSYIHRHELSSLAFLPAFPKDEWNTLIDMVVAHHKSIVNDVRQRGILDLDDNDRNWIANHLKEWNEWFVYGKLILEKFGIECKEISLEEATHALEYAAEYCYQKKQGWSRWRGLLKAADHFGSAFSYNTEKQLSFLFEKPDLGFYINKARESDLFPLSKVDTQDERRHTLVVAPTGAGKTDFLLKRTCGRIFYTLPFQASIDAMWKRFTETIPNKDIRVLHATSKIVVGKNNIEEQVIQPLVGSCIKVLTPHQLAAIIFGTAGYESVMLDIEGCDVILDEVHTYSDFSRAMVLEIVKALLTLNCRVHIGTATMPSVLYNELLRILGGTRSVYEVKLPNDVLKTFNRHQVFKIENEEEVDNILFEAFEKKEKVLVIYNTVKKAQEAYGHFEEIFPEIKKLLIHSRFRRGDRFDRETDLKENFDSGNSEYSPCLVVSTQVVEVSLDISFDRMITMCAPLDSLIQRFGRVNRRRANDTIGHYKPIYILTPSGNVLPYKSEIVKKSFEQLPDGEVLQETEIQQKIDSVFPSLDMKEIDIHLKYKDGQMLMKELADNKKAVIVEALEIESATCILRRDRDDYLLANWEERVNMEIPVSWKVLRWHKDDYEQLKVGSRPFVVPQDPLEYEEYGLKLVEPETIL